MMEGIWKELYDAAVSVIRPYDVSEQMHVGDVGAAVLSKSGKIYTGICIDSNCGLGFCAERNAISTMFANGDYDLSKVCAVLEGGKVVAPCGACLEFIWQMGDGSRDVEILADNDGTVRTLADMLPYAW